MTQIFLLQIHFQWETTTSQNISMIYALEVMMENANEAEEDVQTIRLQAATDAGRMRQQGVNQRLAGQLTLLQGRSQKMAADIQARSQMFGAASSAAMSGYRISQIV